MCLIQTYELYASKDDESTHLAFSTSLIEEGQVKFELLENQITSITYYLKVTAEGGEVNWSEEKTFTTQCGPESARIIT